MKIATRGAENTVDSLNKGSTETVGRAEVQFEKIAVRKLMRKVSTSVLLLEQYVPEQKINFYVANKRSQPIGLTVISQ